MKKLIFVVLLAISVDASAFDIYNGVGSNGKDRFSQTFVRVDPAGYPISSQPTYSYQAADVVPAATATDVVCLVGSATKTIALNRIQITLDATGTSIQDVYIYKRSALNTGGTATQPAITKLDSGNAAATGVINLYSANPTALGAGTLLAADHYQVPAHTGASFFASPWIEDFGVRNSQPVIIRGANEQVCVGFNGAAISTGLSAYIRLEWTEE